MYHNSFLESKKYAKLHIENPTEVNNLGLAPFIVEGTGVFKRQSYFLGSVVIGDSARTKEGQLVYRNGEFLGWNGDQWLSFTRDNLWQDGEGVLFVEGQRIGINKINPKKSLEVGGDVSIDKKLFVGDSLQSSGIILQQSTGKKKEGFIRFNENKFEGYDGEKWVQFGGINPELEVKEDVKEPIDLTAVQQIGLLNCPLQFKGNGETYMWYDWEKQYYNLGRLHSGSYELIKRDDLWIGNLRLDGNIQMNKKTIVNVADPQKSDEVATKNYVDNVCQGLQNYLVVDFLCLQDDVEITEDGDLLKLNPTQNLGNWKENNIIAILKNERAHICEVIAENTVKILQCIQCPAKLCGNNGRYGNSEYVIFDKDEGFGFLQINGTENLEYNNPIHKIGKKISLRCSELFDGGEVLDLRGGGIGDYYMGEGSVGERQLKVGSVSGDKIGEGVIEGRHLGRGSVSGANVSEKSLSGKHLRDGSIKNNHFSPAVVTERELGNESVGMTHIKMHTILEKHLTKGCINGNHLQDMTVQKGHLGDNCIDVRHFNEGVVLGQYICGGAIEGKHLKEGIIVGEHLTNGCVKGHNIGEKQISTEHLDVGLIGGLHIKEQSIGGEHLREQIITDKHILRNSVMDWHIYKGQIKGHHLDENCVESVHLGESVVGEKHLQNGSVGMEKLKRGSVKSEHLAMNSVDDKHLVNFSIKSNKLMEGIVSETKLAENSVTTSKIKDKTITNDKLKLPFIKLDVDSAFVCPQIVNLGETLSLKLNSNYMVPKRRDGVVEFMGSIRFGEQGSGQKMEVNMDMNVEGDIKIRGEKLQYIGEIKCFVDGIRLDEQFMEKWVKCDGARVKRSQYYDLYDKLEGVKEDGDDFYLPDIKQEGIVYYVRFKL